MAMCIAIDEPELVRSMALGSTAAVMGKQEEQGTERWIKLAQSGDLTALTAELIDSLYSENTIGKYKDMLIHMNDGMTEYDIRRFILQTQALDDFLLEAADVALGDAEYMYGDEYAHCVFDEAPDYKQRLLDFFHQV